MDPLKIHYFQHVPFEGLGSIHHWVEAHGFELSATFFWEKDWKLPSVDSIDWLIVMGGPMGVYEENKYSWLTSEKSFIREAIHAGKTVLGICLGAQLIAEVLGAKVISNKEKEIGWFPVQRTEQGQLNPIFSCFPKEVEVFHWHGDTFDLPEGATLLATSEACRNQAFIINENIIGLQFHIEITRDGINQLLHFGKEDLSSGYWIQTEYDIKSGFGSVQPNNDLLNNLLDRLLMSGK